MSYQDHCLAKSFLEGEEHFGKRKHQLQLFIISGSYAQADSVNFLKTRTINLKHLSPETAHLDEWSFNSSVSRVTFDKPAHRKPQLIKYNIILTDSFHTASAHSGPTALLEVTNYICINY